MISKSSTSLRLLCFWAKCAGQRTTTQLKDTVRQKSPCVNSLYQWRKGCINCNLLLVSDTYFLINSGTGLIHSVDHNMQSTPPKGEARKTDSIGDHSQRPTETLKHTQSPASNSRSSRPLFTALLPFGVALPVMACQYRTHPSRPS